MLLRIPWRPVVAAGVLLITAAVFIDYFITHPEVWRQLGEVSPAILVLLLILYMSFVGALTLINNGTLRLCKIRLSNSESALLTMYSSIINFFGPLQSGPAFRALYLKHKHGVKFRDYTTASIVYYFFYGLFSVLLLLSGLLKWWLVLLLAGTVGLILYLRRSKLARLEDLRRLALGNWYYLAGATLAQVALMIVIYYVELAAVAPGASWSQVAIYTGAANLALFVSVTPGAIGFRESFLLLSQNLHGIDTATIVAASAIDRTVYVSLLGLLAIYIFGTHARQRLEARRPQV